MTFSLKTTPLHSTHSTYLFKIFFSLLTLSTAFLQKASGPGKNHIDEKYLGCLKMIYTCTLYPIQWELAKNEGHIVKLQTILH